MFKRLKISNKLMLAFISIGLLPTLIGVIIGLSTISTELKQDALEKLMAIQALKVQQIQYWAEQYKEPIEYLATTEMLSTRYQVLKKFGTDMKVPPDGAFPVDSEGYKTIWGQMSPQLTEFQKVFKFYDVFIISAETGQVMYTNDKEKDLGINLTSGEYKETALARLWKKIVTTRSFAAMDFEPYAPSNNRMTAFIGSPFFDASGNITGVLAAQISPDEVNTTIQNRNGLRKSEEAYLVGQLNGKVSLRSSISTLGNGEYRIGKEIDAEYIEKALRGEKGSGSFKGISGAQILVAYSPIDIYGFHWACITKIQETEAFDMIAKIRMIFFALLIVIAVLVLGISRIFAKSIANPIRRVVDTATYLGQGDLSRHIEIESRDEMGELGISLNHAMEQLGTLVRHVKDASSEIIHSSDELAAGIADLASKTNQQAAAITETSATLEQFSSHVKQNSAFAIDLKMSMESFNHEISANHELVKDVNVTMIDINDSSRKIDDIVNVINDISFQTNLLALNAAVEAARAGEAGRGFAVVAAEVRNLAQKTAESSKTIQEIISRNVESTQRGMELVGKTSDSFNKIVAMMEELSQKIHQISHASNEQASGIEQINQTISQIENVVSQNAALNEEFAATGKQVKANASELQELIRQFTIEEDRATNSKIFPAN
ncbi:MAG: methyl-accepting chemotaxis protein [Candidatus Omnitrophota bacterium]